MIPIILLILMLLALALLIGKIALRLQFVKEVRQLFAGAIPTVNKIFTQQQLVNLPPPVKRYFNHVLKNGQPYIHAARIKHKGQFKPGINKDWVTIKGEQYATTVKPGFIWKGTTTMFTARDMFIGDKGRLIVSLFSLFNIVDASGDKYNQGELLRWLGESVFYPTNLLPHDNLQWIAIDEQSAKLTFNYNGLNLYFIVRFNDAGEITQLETKRYMDDTNLETWVINAANYTPFNNVLVPTDAEVLWRLPTGDVSYAKFIITTVEYNKPTLF